MAQPIDAYELYERVWRMRREDRLSDALAETARVLAQARHAGDAKSLARVLCVMGQLERDSSRDAAAADLYEEAAGLYRRLGDREGLVYALRHSADILRELGRLVEAEPRCAEAVAACRALSPEPLDLANMLRVSALLHEDLGHAGAAKQLWTEAGDLYARASIQAGVDEPRRHGAAI